MGGFGGSIAALLNQAQPQAPQSDVPAQPNLPPPGAVDAHDFNPATNNFDRPSQTPVDQYQQLTNQFAQQNIQQNQPTGHGLKASLQRMAYGFGQAAMKESGLPTDDELQNSAVARAHVQAQTQLAQQQIQQLRTLVPVTLPNGTSTMVPQAIAAKLLPAQVAAQSRTGVAQIGADSRETIATGNNATKTAIATGNNNTALKIAQERAKEAAAKPNEIQLIQRAQNGDKEAQKTLDTLQGRKLQLGVSTSIARGKAFGYYRPGMYYDPEAGQNVPYFQGDAMMAIKDGKKLIPSGPVPAATLIGLQRLNSEATPAIQGVQDNLKAFDNPGDRAVFARVMKDNPMGEGQDPHTWVGNVLNQALKGDLSPQGQQLAIKLNRLNETVSLLRSTLGLPASNGATALTLKLLPGSSTPNAEYAGKQLDELKQVVQQSNVRALGGSAEGGSPSSPSAPVTVTDPRGVVHTFSNPAAAQAFKKAAGIK